MSERVQSFIDVLTDAGVLSRADIEVARQQIPTTHADDTHSTMSSNGPEKFGNMDVSLFLSTDDLRQADETLMISEQSAARDAVALQSTPAAVMQLAHELIHQSKLTEFQARAAFKGDTRLLRCGDYILLDLIGSGGMGHVFKARHERSGELFAIKILRDSARRSPGRLARFHREIEVTSRLSHANIVTAQTAGEANGSHYLVMDLVDGQDLKSVVRNSGPVTVARAVNYILQTARGLDYAHSERLVHRDVKPANLLLDVSDTIRILDLGLVQIVEEEQDEDQIEDVTRLTVQGQVLGTPDYMSPEQAEDTRSVDLRTDIYSLGCTLHFLLTGRPPYLGSTPVEVMMAHSTRPIPHLRHQRANIPVDLDDLFQHMMAKEASDRLESLAPVINRLEMIAASLSEDHKN
jgi:serine/threonine protein kinase